MKRGSTSVRKYIFIADSSSTVGAGLTGLVYNSASLTAYYIAGDLSAPVQITLATMTVGTWATGGFIQVDATNMPGWYEIGIPNAALDGGNEVVIQFKGAANMVPVNLKIELDVVDTQDAVRLGLTALPNAAADAAGGLVISDAGGFDIDNRSLSAAAVGKANRTLISVVTGTVGSSSNTTTVISSALSPAGSAADQFIGRIMIFDENTTTVSLRGQATEITASTASATPQFTVTTLTTAPVSGDTFTIT